VLERVLISSLSSVLVRPVAAKRLALLHLFDQDYKARTISSEYEEVAMPTAPIYLQKIFISTAHAYMELKLAQT